MPQCEERQEQGIRCVMEAGHEIPFGTVLGQPLDHNYGGLGPYTPGMGKVSYGEPITVTARILRMADTYRKLADKTWHDLDMTKALLYRGMADGLTYAAEIAERGDKP